MQDSSKLVFAISHKKVGNAIYTGSAADVVEWLKNSDNVSAYEIYDTPSASYISVPVFLAKYVTPLISKFYRMDPKTDDVLLSGRSLKRGMRVLIEDPDKRVNTEGDLEEWEFEKALANNRWCTVGSIEKNATGVRFVGIYDDETKRVRSFDLYHAWIVKIDSMEEADSRQVKLEQIMIKALADAINIQSFTNSTKDKEVALGTVVRDSIKKIQGLL